MPMVLPLERRQKLIAATMAFLALVVIFALQTTDSTKADETRTIAHSIRGTQPKPTKPSVVFNVARAPAFEPSSGSHSDDELKAIQREYIDSIQPLLKQYCADCHWGADAEADFNLEGLVSLDQLLNGRKKWKKVVVRMVANEMPPEDSEAIPPDRHKLILDWIDNLLNSVDCTTIRPGRVTIRRLNATEYKNTIRDLVGIEYDPADAFPGDDVGYGFDNIADVLSLPPILMEKYLQAAEAITTKAIVDPRARRFDKTILGHQFNGADGSGNEQTPHPLYNASTISYELKVPASGRYTVTVRAGASQAGDEVAKMTVGINGKTYGTKNVSARKDEPKDYKTTVRLKKGSQRLEISFINDFYQPERGLDRNLFVHQANLKGTIGALPATHRQLVGVRPKSTQQQRVAARKRLNRFASKAYRRRATSGELDRLMKLYDASRRNGEGFELGLRFAFQGVLISPHFLYKIEAPTKPGTTRELTDFELATSLSYFLWSTMPDKELFQLATEGKLRQPEIYRGQIIRMLDDPRSEAVVENFVGQWLQLRHLEHFVPDPDLFPGIDLQMRQDMATETKMTVADLIRKNSSIVSIFENEYSFINQRLAEHYGIPGVEGKQFRKVDTSKYGRVGLLTQASILTLTSNPTRTSPVKRGKWIMENLLGEEPPPPDPEAMQLEDQEELTGTLRQRMEQHRADPSCAVCHKVMDELGFALENYDAVGRWRDKDLTNRIDATGELPDGTTFNGADELQRTVKTKMKEQFVRCLTEKLLIYALGRGLEYFDQCTVDKIISQTKDGNYQFSELIIAIANSEPFLKRQGAPLEDAR